jgi:BirA family biotin operon repressor/biotin-[acetyl-CoA-carboxylase] ligase
MTETPYKTIIQNNLRINYFESVSSTMDIARKMSQSNCLDNTIVIANRQHCGRGRLQRQWFSDLGGLYMTWIIRPQLEIHQCFAYTFSAALSIVLTLDQLFQITAHVKWPNDVLIKSQKIAGILTETQFENNQFNYLNIGIGINVNNQIEADAFESICIYDIAQTHIDLDMFTQALCKNLSTHFFNIGVENVLESWKLHNCTLGNKVRIVLQDCIIEGLAVDINQDGALIVACKNGQLKTVTYGDCILNKKRRPT